MPEPKAFVPFIHVASVPRAIAFYRTLGFGVRNELPDDAGGEAVWAYLEAGTAQLMVARADEPVRPEQQAVMFYLYVDDVPAAHGELRAANIDVGDIAYPFYCPRGEFRVTDPDGYTVMITHT